MQLVARSVAAALAMWRSLLTRLAQGATPRQPLDAEVMSCLHTTTPQLVCRSAFVVIKPESR